MKATELTKFVKKPPKPIVIALVVVAILVLCWFAFGKNLWRKYINQRAMSESEHYTGSQTTPYLDFPSLRDRIASAVSGFGTNESEIYAVLSELRTQADWEYLQRYWENSMDKANIGWGGLILSGMLGMATTLEATLKSELNKSELQRCRDILEGNGIIPGF